MIQIDKVFCEMFTESHKPLLILRSLCVQGYRNYCSMSYRISENNLENELNVNGVVFPDD